jgi:hypothetical protein
MPILRMLRLSAARDPRYIASGRIHIKQRISTTVPLLGVIEETCLPSNVRLLWLHYSRFQASCHSIKYYGSLAITTKPETCKNFRTAESLFYILQTNYLNRPAYLSKICTIQLLQNHKISIGSISEVHAPAMLLLTVGYQKV